MDKEQLIEAGKHYFENGEIQVMYATADGNFFYEANKNYGISHANDRKIELFTITRADVGGALPEPAPADVEEPEEETPEEDTGGESKTELYDQYNKETKKKALYRNKETKAYKAWETELN